MSDRSPGPDAGQPAGSDRLPRTALARAVLARAVLARAVLAQAALVQAGGLAVGPVTRRCLPVYS